MILFCAIIDLWRLRSIVRIYMHLSFPLHTQVIPDLALCKLVESSRIVATHQRLLLAYIMITKSC